ncbi:MAG: (2Fe-2S)-binding protein [Bdellovibrionales bacterium]|jgi:bacterioferritin-associated ferredoxin|nr:(2Fe-2S)-binding protein [Bdellovibrionales bacterium]
MYICICHAVSMDDIVKEFQKDPSKGIDKVLQQFKVGEDCGSCKEVVKQLKIDFIKQSINWSS